ncbi:MAG: TetR family transcriptional regulator [Verrucomicrobiota bacterium]
MREIQLPLSEAKQRLLDAAEPLLAERGFEAVSVRDITQLAKANVAAINYHFGTREGLIGWVVVRHLQPLNDERLARLESLERKGGTAKAAPVEEILDAWARPVVGLVRKSSLSERQCCKLLGRLLALSGEGFSQAMADHRRAVNDRFLRALTKSLPSVAPEELGWRMHWVTGGLIHLLLYQELPVTGGAAGAPSLEAVLGRFIRFAAAGLREGVELEPTAAKKGPQATFDFG